MAEPTQTLHQRLIERQSLEELQRKQAKARSRGYWTVEDFDVADRKAKELCELLQARNETDD